MRSLLKTFIIISLILSFCLLNQNDVMATQTETIPMDRAVRVGGGIYDMANDIRLGWFTSSWTCGFGFRFNLTDIPEDAKVISARMYMYRYASDNINQHSIYSYAGKYEWINYNPQHDSHGNHADMYWNSSVIGVSKTIYKGQNFWDVWDITNIYNHWRSTGKNTGVWLSDNTGNYYYYFRGPAYSNPSLRPYLVVTYDNPPEVTITSPHEGIWVK